MQPYEIMLPGVGNVRELGGIEINNKKVRKGVLLRSASLSGAPADTIKLLSEKYHVYSVVDFRMRGERETFPDPEIPGAQNRYCSVMELEDSPGFENLEPEQIGKMLTPGADRTKLLLKMAELGLFSDKLYIGFLSTEKGKAAYREFFKVLIELPNDKAVLWHCTDGKDRTGVAAMLILKALGASNETIIEEYLRTNAQNEEKLKAIRAQLDKTDYTKEQKDIILFGAGQVASEYMLNLLDWLDKTYGDIYGYLEKELSVDQKKIELLRNKFLEII